MSEIRSIGISRWPITTVCSMIFYGKNFSIFTHVSTNFYRYFSDLTVITVCILYCICSSKCFYLKLVVKGIHRMTKQWKCRLFVSTEPLLSSIHILNLTKYVQLSSVYGHFFKLKLILEKWFRSRIKPSFLSIFLNFILNTQLIENLIGVNIKIHFNHLHTKKIGLSMFSKISKWDKWTLLSYVCHLNPTINSVLKVLVLTVISVGI